MSTVQLLRKRADAMPEAVS